MKKLIIICITLVLLSLFFYSVYLNFQNNTTPPIVNYEPQINAKNKEIDSLRTILIQEKNNVKILESKYDSLKMVKPKIKIKYEKVYEKIDSSTTDNLINEFSVVFSNENIK